MNDYERKELLMQIVSAIGTLDSSVPGLALLKDVFQRMYNRGNLKLLVEGIDDVTTSEGANIAGMYDKFDNTMTLVIRKANLGKKFFGLVTDYGTVNTTTIHELILTTMHELQHFAAFNYTLRFRKIWGNIQRKFLLQTIYNLIVMGATTFLPPKATYASPQILLQDQKFAKAFAYYFASTQITDTARIINFLRTYNQITDYLYRKTDFGWARFFDNVLVAGVDLSTLDISTTRARKLANALRLAYCDLWPDLVQSPHFRRTFFYQEIFAPSEIVCVLAGSGVYPPDVAKCLQQTFELF
jgi:hypothetical protein